MLLLETVLFLCGIVLLFYLVFPFFSTLVSRTIREVKIKKAQDQLDFACIITAYKENIKLVYPLVEALEDQLYSNFGIYVVADGCEGYEMESTERTTFLKPANRLDSKVKSFRFAMDNFKRQHDAVVIFDPDNIPQRDFLRIVNDYMGLYYVVQGCRRAKNIDTVYASADATGEIYKNYIERQVPYLLGSSSTIAGSGMAIETGLFKDYLDHESITSRLKRKAIIVEDKLLQNFIVNKGIQIAFAREAVVYDEKVTTARQVQHQRSRWLYSYFANLPKSLRLLVKGITGPDLNQLILGITTSSPPMFLLLFGSILIGVASFLVNKWLAIAMLIGLVIFISNIFLVLWLSRAPNEIWRAMWGMPLFVFSQLLALFKMNLSRKKFLLTPNKKVMSLKDIEGRVQ